MCYINIYAVTRNQVLLLIKPKVFNFFSFELLRKKGRNIFVGQCQERKDSNNGAQAHTLGSSSKSGWSNT